MSKDKMNVTPKVKLQWIIVQFLDDGKIRAVPSNWIIGDYPAKADADEAEKSTLTCFFPKVQFEFDLNNLISKCVSPKQLWPKYKVQYRTSADSFKEAKKKEELSLNLSGSEVDSAYNKLLKTTLDRKTRSLRHKKKHPVEDSDKEKSASDDESVEEEQEQDNYDDHNKDSKKFVEYPKVPDLSTVEGDVGSGIISHPAKRSRLNILSLDMSTEEKNDSEEVGDGIKKNSPMNISDTEKELMGGTTEEDNTNVSSKSNELVEECQNHDLDSIDGYAILKLEQFNEIMTVPYKWQTLDFKFCYWPPLGTEFIIKDYIMPRVDPTINWIKISIIKVYDYVEQYDEARRSIKVNRRLEEEDKENGTKNKPRIIDEVVISPPSTSTLKRSAPEFHQLGTDDKLKVIYHMLEESNVKNNKILVSLGNVQNIGRGAEDTQMEEIYCDIPCKTAAELERLEEKLEKNKEYKKAFKVHMKSLSSKSGHHLMQSMISAAMVDELQSKLNFCGKKIGENTANHKVPFNSLFLWPVLRDAAVEKFCGKYSVTDAESIVKRFVKCFCSRTSDLETLENFTS